MKSCLGPLFCFEFWELPHLICGLSKMRSKYLSLQAAKLTKWQLFHSKGHHRPFWVKYMSFCAFAQLVTIFIFFSAWDRSRVKWDNPRKSTQKMRTLDVLEKYDSKETLEILKTDGENANRCGIFGFCLLQFP